MVFAMFSSQFCDGLKDTRTQQLLPLLKVTLVAVF